jgi:hemoglobin
MKHLKISLAVIAAAAVLAGCASAPPAAPPTKDGELAMPTGYKSWPRFLPTIDREDVKQVRDIYMNPVSTQVKKGEAFPQGSRFVMEIYAAAANADGSLRKDANGRLVKGNLMHVYVMGKEANWGGDVPEAIRNGNWIYSAYKPDGSANTPIVNTCRGCHTPLKKDDYVIHVDRYFAERKSAFTVEQIHAQAGMAAQLADAQAVKTLAHASR